jgi:hypothetical protein
MSHSSLRRRHFLQASTAAAVAAGLGSVLPQNIQAADPKDVSFSFGLVTYMWGAEWDLPTLLANCKKAGLSSVELRTTHAHKVEPNLTEEQRGEVQKRFADSGIICVGIGSDERFDNPDPAIVKKAIEKTKDFIRLSHDIGGSGVKVKPDSWHKDVPHEKTIEQIGKALNEVGEYAAGFGQEVRLEVHGQCAEIPTIKAIMDIAKDQNVFVCWNSNEKTDLADPGFEANFKTLRPRFGRTVHVREFQDEKYPFKQLIAELVKTEWEGFVLCEAASKQEDKVAALIKQKELFDQFVKAAR